MLDWGEQQIFSFGYDPNGNTTTISGSYNLTATSHNWRNLPLSITKSSVTYSYKYDHHAGSRTGLGNRTRKSSGNVNYVRGAFGEVLAVYNSSTLVYRNILRPDGTVIGRREGSNRLYYHRDHLGSTKSRCKRLWHRGGDTGLLSFRFFGTCPENFRDARPEYDDG